MTWALLLEGRRLTGGLLDSDCNSEPAFTSFRSCDGGRIS